jgi:hypothetical protein
LVFSFGRYARGNDEGSTWLSLFSTETNNYATLSANVPITISYNITGSTSYDGYTMAVEHTGLPNSSKYPYEPIAYSWNPWYGWNSLQVEKGTFTPTNNGIFYLSCNIWTSGYSGDNGSLTIEITYLKIGDELIIGYD